MQTPAVTLATSDSLYDATTSARGPFSLVVSGVAGTSWTSGALSDGMNYWFTVSVLIGTMWTGAQSVASGESASNNESPFCVQL